MMAADAPTDAPAACDAVLVGATVGSFVAALRLHDAGLTPVILEKTPLVGGGTAYSGGVVWAPANSRMLAKGIADSVADGLAYLEQIGGSSWNRAQATTYVTDLPEALAYVEDTTGLRWVTYSGLPDYFTEVPGGRAEGRVLLPLPAAKAPVWERELLSRPEMSLVRRSLHTPGAEDEWAAGRVLIAALWKAVLDRGIAVHLNTAVVELEPMESPRIVVVAECGGRRVRFDARRGVLLNTGGYEWDAALTDRHVGQPAPEPQTPPGNTGDGQMLAARLGAPLSMMDKTIAIPSVEVTSQSNDGETLYRIFFQPLAKPHSIVVNARGTRFANETFFPAIVDGWHLTDGTGQLLNVPCYFVFDQQYVDAFGMPPGLDDVTRVYEADSVASLEVMLDLPASSLQKTLDDFNALIDDGRDEQFGRGATAYQRAFGDHSVDAPASTIGSVRVAPFYAVELHPSTSGHRGGVTIDVDGRVLDSEGVPIAGLYACGNVVAGSVTGDVYISGATIGHALVFASRAAGAMLEQ